MIGQLRTGKKQFPINYLIRRHREVNRVWSLRALLPVHIV